MAKLCKKDTNLNERDTLADMRAAELSVLRAYACAVAEGGSQRLRTELINRFAEEADDLYTVSAALRGTENFEAPPALRELAEHVRGEFVGRAKELVESD